MGGKQWKIQGDRKPSDFLSRGALWDNILKDIHAQILASLIFHKVLTLGKRRPKALVSDSTKPEGFFARGKRLLKAAVMDNEEPEEPKSTDDASTEGAEKPSECSVVKASGWAGIRFKGPSPSVWTHVWQVVVAYFGYDMMFYWSHRLMHHKKLYKHCHKVHHQFHTSIGINASHEHILESVVQLLNWYVPIGFAGFLNRHKGGLHISTLFWYHCFRWIETVDAHCGYEFPFSPFYLLWPICGGARMHDYHHRAFDGNYGASFFWDRLCGTDMDFWKEVLDEGGFLVGGSRVPS